MIRSFLILSKTTGDLCAHRCSRLGQVLNSDTRCRPLLAMLFPGRSKGWVGGPWGGVVVSCPGLPGGLSGRRGGGGECLWCWWGRGGLLCQFWLVPCLSGVFCLYVQSVKVHWLAHLKATLYNLEGFPLLLLLRTKKRGLV